ncbi:putative holliday junction resolvase [Erwinia phage Fifi067]|nr:putative holliday junction resolvase [Erwinia phage Fifi067]
MQIPVAGFDPSLNSWGIAEGMLDLEQGYLNDLVLQTVEPEKKQGKQVRQNSVDIQRAEDLATTAIMVARRSKVVFVECPVGSQSANGMKAYGIVVGVLGAIRSLGIPVIEVTAMESKKIFTGDKNATKQKMIDAAVKLYPDANFPMYRGQVAVKAEHVADAIAAIHAGVQTPVFQNLMRLFAEVK